MFWVPSVRQVIKLVKNKWLGATNYGLLPYAASYIFPYSVNHAACKRKESKSLHCLQSSTCWHSASLFVTCRPTTPVLISHVNPRTLPCIFH